MHCQNQNAKKQTRKFSNPIVSVGSNSCFVPVIYLCLFKCLSTYFSRLFSFTLIKLFFTTICQSKAMNRVNSLLMVMCLVSDLQRSAKGEQLFDKVCQHLSISNNEKDYFCCSYKDDRMTRVSQLTCRSLNSLQIDELMSSRLCDVYWWTSSYIVVINL